MPMILVLMVLSWPPYYLSQEPGTGSNTIQTLFARLEEANNKGCLALIESQYANDAEWYAPNQGLMSGWENLSPYYQEAFRQFDIQIEFRLREIDVMDESAYVSGETTGLRIHTPSGDTTIINDWFMAKLIWQEEQWKIRRLIWNSSGQQR